MAQFTLQIVLLFLFNISYVQGISFKFTNITCISKDAEYCTVDYCYIGHINPKTNYISVRFMQHKPIYQDLNVNLRFIMDRNGWKQNLYATNIDLCRFLKSHYNAVAKMVFLHLDGHTNINHPCPYTTEKYLTVDKIINTEVAKKTPTVPVAKGHYVMFSKWSLKNVTIAETNIYFEILSS